MKKCVKIFTGVALVLGLPGLLLVGRAGPGQPQSFEVASVHFEQNATDGDMEVVFEIKGGDDGLAKLKVISPDGRSVIDFKAPDPSTMGIRQFRMESPEPEDVAGLKAAYPEGVYLFAATTAAGDEFHAESTLDHTLPATVSFLTPGPEAQNVRIDHLEISWTPVENVAAYLIEIEQEEMDVSIKAKLPGSVTKFALPAGFVLPGTEYKFSIGTMAADGNLSFVEAAFVTADDE